MAACGVSKCGPAYPDAGACRGAVGAGAAAGFLAAWLVSVTGRCAAAGDCGLVATATCADVAVLVQAVPRASVNARTAAAARRRSAGPSSEQYGAALPLVARPDASAPAFPRCGVDVIMMSPSDVKRDTCLGKRDARPGKTEAAERLPGARRLRTSALLRVRTAPGGYRHGEASPCGGLYGCRLRAAGTLRQPRRPLKCWRSMSASRPAEPLVTASPHAVPDAATSVHHHRLGVPGGTTGRHRFLRRYRSRVWLGRGSQGGGTLPRSPTPLARSICARLAGRPG
jgi:hypothetical protein